MNQGGTNDEVRRSEIPLHVPAQLLTYLAGKYPEVRRYCSLNLIRQPWSSDTMGGSTSGGDISDPTGETAVNDKWKDHIHAMDQCAWFLTKLVVQMDRLTREVPVPRPADVVDPRCNGGSNLKGSADWGRPECERNAVTSDGLCDACRQRRDYWVAKERERAA